MNVPKQSELKCEILAIETVTHDVQRFIVEKPVEYQFEPGQATEVSLDLDGWRDKTRPFTFTSLPADENLEFTIKRYPQHEGVTDETGELKTGDHLILREPWGAITYRGPGLFIAGGAGVTPFIAILRHMQALAATRDADNPLKRSTLLFSNKTERDIILHGEFTRMLGPRAIYTLTRENKPDYRYGRIDHDMIQEHLPDEDQPVYLCGPPAMVDDLGAMLQRIGLNTDQLVIEQ